jgi:nicotinamidase-related amidase
MRFTTSCRRNPARTALLVIDMQNEIPHEGASLLVPDADATTPAIGRLLKLARANQIRVAYSRAPTATATPNGRPGPSTHEGSWGRQIVSELVQARMRLFCARFATTPDLRHCRHDLRALHSGECGAALRS